MLLPLGDDNTQRVSFPVVTLGLIAANVLVFMIELQQGDPFVYKYSLIPSEFFGGAQPFTNVITSMFLHGGWAHLLGNMLYLYIFGDNVEDNLGKGQFLIFYFLCGIVAMLAQAFASPDSSIPSLGASGAIAGVLAAYIILFPHNRVRVLVFFPFITTMSAWFVLGLWIAMQLFSGYTSMFHHSAMEQGGVAYMAHIGGFFAGVILTFVFRSRQAQRGVIHRLGMSDNS